MKINILIDLEELECFQSKIHFGNVVGFSARILPEFDDGKMGKYINSPINRNLS